MSRKVLVPIAVLCLLASTSFALDFMGPPTAGLQKGQWSVGPTYSYSEGDVEIKGDYLTLVGIGTIKLDGAKIVIDDVEVKRYFARFGYGLEDWCELIFGAGLSDVDADDRSYSGGIDYAFDLGAKITFAEQGNLSWGALFQASWLNTNDKVSYGFGGSSIEEDWDIDVLEMQIALGPTLKMEGWSLYGGALLYFLDGEADVDVKVDGVGIGSASGDIDNDSQFGGYIGTQIDIGTNTTLSVEYTLIEDGWGIGAGITWLF